MKKAALVCALSAALTSPLGAADDSLVRFDGGIGVIPVSSIALNDPAAVTGTIATGTRNFVRGVPPPGQIWVIKRLRAEVDTDSRIVVDGRGLLLGGGNNVGFNANARVFATLICGTAAPFTVHSTPNTPTPTNPTPGVPLAANGDFFIDDTLAPPVPDTCPGAVLLIRNTGGTQPWFAAGIQKPD